MGFETGSGKKIVVVDFFQGMKRTGWKRKRLFTIDHRPFTAHGFCQMVQEG